MTCSHPSLRSDSTCKDCDKLVDIRQKRAKYGNKRENGFDSRKEARRYDYLRDMEQVGAIKDLTCQPVFVLRVRGEKVCAYKADFSYTFDGKKIVEDVKSNPTRTPVYRLKKKLMRACLGIEVQEI